jgi:hypothetical protein
MPIDPRTTDESALRVAAGAGLPARRVGASTRARAAIACVWGLGSVLACDDPVATGPSDGDNGAPVEAAPAEHAVPPSSAPPSPASDPWADVLASRVLVEGRLGPGSKLVALETIAEPDAKPVCGPCSLGKTTKLVVAAALDDEAAHETLRDLDAIHRFYADNGLAAVMVLAPRDRDRLITPPDAGAEIGRALALRDRLRLALPVHVPARVDDGGNRVWDEYYAVDRTPLVLLVGPDDRVLFSAAAPPDWAALDQAIVDALDHALAKSPAGAERRGGFE